MGKWERDVLTNLLSRHHFPYTDFIYSENRARSVFKLIQLNKKLNSQELKTHYQSLCSELRFILSSYLLFTLRPWRAKPTITSCWHTQLCNELPSQAFVEEHNCKQIAVGRYIHITSYAKIAIITQSFIAVSYLPFLSSY